VAFAHAMLPTVKILPLGLEQRLHKADQADI
jgi:hypothetical protein